MNATGIRGNSCFSWPAHLIYAATATMCLFALSCSATSRSPTSQPISREQPADAGDAQIPTLTLKHLGTIKLESHLPPEPPIRDVLDFDIDDHGRIGFIRVTKEVPFVLVSPDGEVLVEIGLEKVLNAVDLPSVRWAGGDRWVIVGNKQDTGLGWLVDVATKRVAPIEDFECPRIEAIAGDRRGGFVVLGSVILERFARGYRSRMELIGFDSQGRRLWYLPEDDEDIRLPSEASIGLLSNGDVAVLDISGNCWTLLELQVFNQAGTHVRKIDLDGYWNRRDGNLAVAPDDRLVVAECYDRPPTVRCLGVDGSEESVIKPGFSDDRPISCRDGVRISADGRLWACDGESFFKLDEKGIVDRILGEEQSDQILRKIGGRRIDQQGRTYLTNERTGSVHVFDAGGKRIHVLKQDPQEFEKLGLEWSTYGHLPRPAGGELRTVHSNNDTLWLIDSDGESRHAITHRPDGDRLRSVAGVALSPDGKLAVVCNDLDRPSTNDDYTLNLYTQDGDPIRTVPIPIDGGIDDLTFDGRFAVFGTWDDRDLFVLDTESGAVRRIVSQTRDRDQKDWRGGGYPFLTKQGAELWLLHITTRTIERYAWEPQQIEAAQRAPSAP